jgi:hypothetical protein
MSIATSLDSFGANSPDPGDKDPPNIPDDNELEEAIAPEWAWDFPVSRVYNINALRQDIRDTVTADDPIEEWSKIIGSHLSCGNSKLADEIAIYNIGSATDCPNIGTKHCQVPERQCYAARNEQDYPDTGPISSRRREIIIWDHLDAATFSRAFARWHERKEKYGKPVTALRLNESGDFRHTHDLFKADEIARKLKGTVDVYTYSASDYLPWHKAEHLTVNRSNDRKTFGSRRFEVVDHVKDIPDGSLRCPHDLSDGEIKCGDCRLCIDQADETDGDPNIYVKNFYTDDEE